MINCAFIDSLSEQFNMTATRRRDFLKTMALAGAALAAPKPSFAKRTDDKRPNIILFLTDDQDKESIGAYGANVLSPNFDRLAREGVLFNHAYVSSTVCTPSRYSFLTGRYAGRSYCEWYLRDCPPARQGFPHFNVELEQDNMNVGAVLSKAGYRTGYVGKFHVGPDLKRAEHYEEHGLKYIDREAKASPETSAAFRHNELWYRDYFKKRGFDWAKNIYWANLQKPYNNHNPEWTIAAALEFIEDSKDKPFYLHYCTTLLHGPDKEWRDSMDHPLDSGAGTLDELPDVMTDRKELLRRLDKKGLDPLDGHAGNTWIDDSLGAVLKKLDELGIADNTLIVVIADHGSNMKGSLFKVDGVNVPCIARWPKGAKAGVQCDELIQNIDFAPTFFDLAGADVPEQYVIDGVSIRPLLEGTTPKDWRDHLYFEIGSGRAVTTKDWKYIAVRHTKEHNEKIRNSSLENLPVAMSYFHRSGIGLRGAVNKNFFDTDHLYNISRDDLEKKNLAKSPEHRAKLEEMRAMLTKDLGTFARPFGEFIPGGDAAPGGQIEEQVELVKQLKVQGKNVIVPDHLKTPGSKPPAKPKSAKQAEREAKRAKAKAAKGKK